jgi:cytochrome b6-f complex iron-sulfur subunit
MALERTSRRDFLGMTVATAAAVCTGCALVGSRKPDVEADLGEGSIRLGRAQSTSLLRGDGSLLVGVKGGKQKILVVHLRDGQLIAVSAICTHMGCTVAYKPEAGRIVCPCHGSEYSPDGANLKGPAKRPLTRYAARNEDGRIVITL